MFSVGDKVKVNLNQVDYDFMDEAFSLPSYLHEQRGTVTEVISSRIRGYYIAWVEIPELFERHRRRWVIPIRCLEPLCSSVQAGILEQAMRVE